MKKGKVLSLLLVFIFISSMVFSGCSSKEEKTATAPAPSVTDAAADSAGGAADAAQEGAEVTPSGKIVEWNWNELMCQNLKEIYNKQFPDVDYEYVIVNTSDYMQKLQITIASGGEMPDIILGESAFRGALFSLDILENLESAPYNFDRNELIDAVVPGLSNDRGELVGFDQQFCAAGWAYRRDLTEKYFGVSEPEDVAALLSDWDSFIAAGKKLAEQTKDVYMLASIQDLLDCAYLQNASDYIDGMTIDLTSRFSPAFDLITKVRDAGVPLGNMEQGSTEWNASYAKGNVIFYNMPSWGSKTYVAGNAPETEGKGLWGLVKAPGNGFLRGGTSVGIYSGSENKDTAYAMLKYLYTTTEGASQMYDRMGYIYSFKDFYEGDNSPINKAGFYDGYYNGQNIGKYFYEQIAPTTVSEPMSYYTSSVNDALTGVKAMLLADSSMTSEEALKTLMDETALNATGATIK